MVEAGSCSRPSPRFGRECPIQQDPDALSTVLEFFESFGLLDCCYWTEYAHTRGTEAAMLLSFSSSASAVG